MTPEIDRWLRTTILHSTPAAQGYDTVLWTLDILVDLLKKQFGLWVSDSTVAVHLHQMDLSCQRPCYQARQQDPRKVEDFLNRRFPMIQRVAEKMGADIAFEDETGIGIPTRSGRTWGAVNSPPTVIVNRQRGGVITCCQRLRRKANYCLIVKKKRLMENGTSGFWKPC